LTLDFQSLRNNWADIAKLAHERRRPMDGIGLAPITPFGEGLAGQ